MRIFHRLFVLWCACLWGVCAAWPVFANGLAGSSAESSGLSAQTWVRQAEDYLQNLETARARFVQTAHDGTQVTGTFYLHRPGRLRFEYDPPIEDFIVSDGFFIYFYDSVMQEQTNAPIGQTLANFLLRTDIRLSGDVQITEIDDSGAMIQIALVQSSDPAGGTLRLGFRKEPFRLRKWRVTDAQGLVTEVELFQFETGMHLPRDLFVYKDPAHGKIPRYNR